MKRYLRATCLSIGAAVMLSVAALTQPSPDVQAQVPTPKPAGAPAPAPAPKPAGAPATTAPRAGGFPLELAMPLVAGGAAAVGAGTYLLRRKR